jgi:enoyl-CoA hydratase/carnithine racemase
MESSSIVATVAHHVGQITLDRPQKRNALTTAMVKRTLEVLTAFENDRDVRVVLLRGSGAAFCSGVDLADMQATREQSGAFDFDLLPELFARVSDCPKPTVASVHGPAIAGGCELALHCDLRIGSRSARFAMPLAKIGLVIPAYAAERLVQTVGLTAARDLLLTGDAIDAQRAERIGLLSRLVDDNDLAATTDHVVQALAQNAPLALQAMKRILASLAPTLTAEQHATFDAERLQVSRSEDLREGLQAFFDRRPPVFRGH